MKILVFIYKLIIVLKRGYHTHADHLLAKIIFETNKVKFGSFRTTGLPDVRMNNKKNGLTIGAGFSMNNGNRRTPIGALNRCLFYTDKKGTITIGNNVGMSQTTIISTNSVIIGDNVKLGGGVKIYTTDFHSLDSNLRKDPLQDIRNRKEAPVNIGDNAFIGAFSIILKGVTIGENAIVGAGSLVTKNIPANQIWAGNPARFIREVTTSRLQS